MLGFKIKAQLLEAVRGKCQGKTETRKIQLAGRVKTTTDKEKDRKKGERGESKKAVGQTSEVKT